MQCHDDLHSYMLVLSELESYFYTSIILHKKTHIFALITSRSLFSHKDPIFLEFNISIALSFLW
jgi:hypothetical protein